MFETVLAAVKDLQLIDAPPSNGGKKSEAWWRPVVVWSDSIIKVTRAVNALASVIKGSVPCAYSQFWMPYSSLSQRLELFYWSYRYRPHIRVAY